MQRFPSFESLEGRLLLSVTPDRFEPNEGQPVATDIGVAPGVHLQQLTIHDSADQDWYRFELLRPDRLRFGLQFNPAAGDLTFQLFADGSSTVIANSAAVGSGAQIASQNLPAGTYLVKVVGAGGDTNEYSLAIDLDTDSAPVSTTRVFYVNDGDTNNDFYSTAVGNDSNNGLTPATPKATIQSILNDYDVGPADLVLIDTGTYSNGAEVTADDEGSSYVGSPGISNLLDAINLVDADFNLIYRLSFSGSVGVYVHPATNGNPSINNRIVGNSFQGASTAIQIEGGVDNVLENNSITGGGYGIRLTGVQGATLRLNDIDGSIYGVSAEGSASVTAEQNDINAINYAFISTSSTVVLNGNDLHGAQYGFFQDHSTVTATNNDIYDNQEAGFYSSIYSSAVVRGNQVHHNNRGLEGVGTFGGNSWSDGQANDIHNNTVGIVPYTGMQVAFNRIHDNVTGIRPAPSVSIHHNVLYRNSAAVLVTESHDVDIYNNTVYSPSGNGIVVQQNSHDVHLRNNIVWAQGGYALHVATNSQQGFASDYNNFYKTGSGPLIWWQKSFYDVFDWQSEADFDGHSIGYTTVDPNRDNPSFAAGTDNFHLSASSTSIDSGDPSDLFNQEQGRNGGRIDLGAYGNTAESTQSATKYLRIDYPEYYTDWPAEEGRPILWRTYDESTADRKLSGNVTITLHQEGVGQIREIAQVSASVGSFGWSPQFSSVPGSVTNRYWIQISSDQGVADTSREKFSIPIDSDDYYVNDDSTANDEYSTAQYPSAIGNNRNTGKTPSDPKATLLPTIRSYDLAPGDTVHVNTGDYIHVRNVLLSNTPGQGNDEGFIITGPEQHVATIDRANPHAGSTNIELNDGDFITLKHLTLTGANMGVWVHNGSTNFSGQYLILSYNTRDGIRLESDASASIVDSLQAFNNGGTGIYIGTPISSLSNSNAHHNANYGINLSNTGGTHLENNDVYANGIGIGVVNSLPAKTIVGNANLPLAAGNRIFDNTATGVFATGNVAVEGNTVHGHIGPGDVGIYLGEGAEARKNVVYDNDTGIRGGKDPRDTVLVENNRVFGNTSYGIDIGRSTLVSQNVVYDNDVGIRGEGGYLGYFGDIRNNVVYENTTSGITVNQGTSVDIVNNTVYQPDGNGNAVTVDTNSSGISLANNILWVNSGFGISVASNSQNGFSSDFNLLRTQGTGKVASWQGIARENLSAWQNTIFQDQNSSPHDPHFVNPGSADFHLQSPHGSFHNGSLAPVLSATTGLPIEAVGTWTTDASTSPAIDRGRAGDDHSNEPSPNGGYINIGAYGNTQQESKSPLSYVLVTRPDGGEVWPAEQEFAIRWRTDTNFTGDVGITLVQNDSTVHTVAASTPNTGEVFWTIPNTIPAAPNYRLRITRLDGSGLDDSNADFQITAPISIYYVNDNDTAGDAFTAAVGSDANDGLSPQFPKASIAAVLAAYSLHGNAIIKVDAGTYNLDGNIVLDSDDNDFKILGVSNQLTVLDRGNQSPGSHVFTLAGSDNVSIENLAITGAEYGVYGANGADSDYFKVLNARVYDNTSGNIYLDVSNDNAVVSNSTSSSASTGIYAAGENATVVANQIFDAQIGVSVHGASSEVTNNEIYNNSVGISSYFVGTEAQSIRISGNDVQHNSSTGISASYQVIVADNQVWGQLSGTGIEVGLGAVARRNAVFDNDKGISDLYYYSSEVDIQDNYVYHNNLGITAYGKARVTGNVVHSNTVGILGRSNAYSNPFLGEVSGNLLYANVDHGIHLFGGQDADVLNNTVRQAIGNAVFIDASSSITVRNNVLSTTGGYNINVSENSQVGFSSDYNTLHFTGSGKLGRWSTREFTDLVDWRYELGLDQHSHTSDPQWTGASSIAAYNPTLPQGAAVIIDDGSPGFSLSGSWSTSSDGFQGDSKKAETLYADSDATAQWTFSGLDPESWYEVAVTWTPDPSAAYDARYTVVDGAATIQEYSLDQHLSPDDFSDAGAAWERIGTHYIRGTSLVVQLSNYTAYNYGTPFSVTADAVRIQKIAGYGGVADTAFDVPASTPTIDAGDPADMVLREPGPNGGRINQGHTGNTVRATNSATQLVQVLSPNGLEKLEQDQAAIIEWRSAGLATHQVAALINVAGERVNGWHADEFLTSATSNGTVSSSIDTSLVTEPAPEQVYQSFASSHSDVGSQLAWQLPAADGSYTVRLHFMEPYYGSPASRQFDIQLQGTTVATDYDIFAAAGAQFTATTLSYPVTPSGGQGIDLRLINKLNTGAIISGIELLLNNAAGVPAPTANIYLSTDGGANWPITLASNVPMDHLGRGEYSWSAGPQTNNARIQIRANQGTLPSDQSDQSFLVANNDNRFYVNDGSRTGDQLTADPGDNSNSGKEPSQPMASLGALVRAYNLDPTDVVYVDAGSYSLMRNIVLTEEDSGFKIQGPSTLAATLDRGNTNSGSYVIELAGADDITISRLHLTGGESGVYAGSTSGSLNLKLTENRIFNNSSYNVYIGASNRQATLEHNSLYDSATGIYINAPASFLIENYVYNNATGIDSSYVGSDIGIAISLNEVHHNSSRGIVGQGDVDIFSNSVWGNRGPQTVGIELLTGAVARKNDVFDNSDGISQAQWYSQAVTVKDNRVFHNSLSGITVRNDSVVEGNVVYSNSVGIHGALANNTIQFSGDISNNLLYGNTNEGVRLSGANGAKVFNNTINQVVGDAILVHERSSNVDVRNNVLAVSDGYDIHVANDSQVGFTSDYNNLFTTAEGKLGNWQRDFSQLDDWRYELGLDQHSHTSDPQWTGGVTIAAYNPTGALGAPEIIDDSIPNQTFALGGTWSTSSDGFQGDSKKAETLYADSNALARWTFNVDSGAWYEVSITWTPELSASYDARFTVQDGAAVMQQYSVNQNVSPDDFADAGATWERLGTHYINGNSLVVQLSNYTANDGVPYTVLADAVRIQKIAGYRGVADTAFDVPASTPTIDAGDPADMVLREPGPNGGRINQGHTGNTQRATNSPTQLVQVLSPNGLEKLEQGQATTIQWRSAGLAGNQVAALINVAGDRVDRWHADEFLTSTSSNTTVSSSVDTSAVTDPAPEQVYQSFASSHFDVGSQLAWQLPAADGDYTLRLHFMEPYYSAVGNRQFDIRLQGTTVATDYDIFASAGALLTATTLSYTVTASGGQGIALALINKLNTGAIVSGIELLLNNAAGVPAPTANIDLSTDGGATWTPLASDVPMDHLGRGEYAWSPGSQTDNARIQIRANQGTLPSDQSDQSFLVTNSDNRFYVNDGSRTGDQLTDELGNNSNSGKKSTQPMASLGALVRAYNLDPNDIVYVDTGSYSVLRNIVLTEEDSGVAIQGPATVAATLDRGNTNNGSYGIEMAGADNVNLNRLNLTGGAYGIYAGDLQYSDGFELAESEIHDNPQGNVYIGTANNGARLLSNHIYEASTGVTVSGEDAFLSDNEVHGHQVGLQITGARSWVTDSDIYSNAVGISVSNSTGLVADAITISENQIHHNSSRGISAYNNVLIADNQVWAHSSASAVGIELLMATATDNDVYDNYVGIQQPTSYYYYMAEVTVANNRVYHNETAGISVRRNSSVTRNIVYSNSIGIEATYDIYSQPFTGIVSNNLVYANTNHGIHAERAYGAVLRNNTVYQEVGNAILVDNQSSDVDVRNNILWIEAGYDIYVDGSSQTGFNSDYNVLYKGNDPNAQVAYWGGLVLDEFTDWTDATPFDDHSSPGNPNFVDFDGADNVLGYTSLGVGYNGGLDDNFYQARLSPAIDSADGLAAPATDILNLPRVDDPGVLNTGTGIGYADIGAYEFRGNSNDATPPQVLDTTPLFIEDGGSSGLRVTSIQVFFSEELNTIDANAAANYELRRSVNGVLGDGDDIIIEVSPDYSFDGGEEISVSTLNFDGALPADTYRLTVHGNAGSSIHDTAGNRLDGNRDGTVTGGVPDEYIRTFAIRPAGILVSPTSGLTTTEAGGSANFNVVLNSQPASDVTIPLSIPAVNGRFEGQLSKTTLTFTSANWDVAQTVTVTGVNDFIDDGNVAYAVVIGAASSGDLTYHNLDGADVTLSNTDNDTAGITVSPTSGLTTTEAGGTASFTIKLNSQPTANVTISLSSGDTTEGTVSAATVTFTDANWSVTQTITITGVDDSIDDDNISYTIITSAAVSTDSLYSGMNPSNVSVSNTDNDTAGFIFSRTSGIVTTESGGADTFTIQLATEPTANVTVSFSSDDATEGTISPGSITFTPANWSAAQTVTATGVDDTLSDGDISYSVVTAAATSSDAKYNGLDPSNVSALNIDNEAANVDIRMLEVFANGGTTLTLKYEVLLGTANTFEIGLYRSVDLLAGGDTQATTVAINQLTDRTVGLHTKTFTIGTAAGQVPLPGTDVLQNADVEDDYYLLAVADHLNTVSETDADALNEDNTAVFTGGYQVSSQPLMIHGGSGNDVATLTISGANLSLAFNGVTTTRPAATVSQVRARLHAGNDTITGTTANKSLVIWGGEGNDSITGSAQADTFVGGAGNDTVTGNAGTDVHVYDADIALGADTLKETSGVDTLDFSATSSAITVNLALATMQVVNSNLSINLQSASTFENVIGGAGADTITGNTLANLLDGGGGADSLTGNTGNDTFVGGVGNDTAIGGAGNDVYLFDADTAIGTDTLDEAGGGTDTLNYSQTVANISVDLTLGTTQTINSNLSLNLKSGSTFENVTAGDGNDSLVGNSLANRLEGAGGNDTMSSGTGNDTYAFDADNPLGSDRLSEPTSGGTDLLDFSATSTGVSVDLALPDAQVINGNLTLTLQSATNFENLVGGSGDDTLRGNGLINSISGNGGNDLLVGGAGNDIYPFDTDLALGSDTVDEAGGGMDTLDFITTTTIAIAVNLGSTATQVVNSNLSLVLLSDAHLEKVVGGSLADSIIGNALANTLSGGPGDDSISAAAGNDTLVGAAGNDNLSGGEGNDVYQFDADVAANTDTIDESAGGIDTLDFATTTTNAIAIHLGTVAAQVVNPNLSIVLLSDAVIENVVGGSLGDTITGNALNNSLTGGLGNDSISSAGGDDSLTGAAGNDSLIGGSGDDTYLFDADAAIGTDTVDEATDGGSDWLNFFATTGKAISLNLGITTQQTLNVNHNLLLASATTVEHVIGTSLGDTITGHSANNLLFGGKGNDTVSGGGGRDLLFGGTGVDSLMGGLGQDIVIGALTSYFNESSGAVNRAALNAIMLEWTRPPVDPNPSVDYAARIANLKNGGGLNGSTLLNTSVVSDDSTTIDQIFGNEELDWLWKSSTDALGDEDNGGDETVQAL